MHVADFRNFPKYSCVTTVITHSFSTSFGSHNGDDATQVSLQHITFQELSEMSSKTPAILATFQTNFNFLHKLSKYTQIPNFTKIRLLGAELFSMRMVRHDEDNSHSTQRCERS
jgi:hypothetical protein